MWDCDDGKRRKFWGDVVSVGGTGDFKVTYDNGDTATMTEAALLKCFDVMKKELLLRARKRRHDCTNAAAKRSRRR